MKQFHYKHTGRHNSIFVVPIGDVHFGNKYHDPKYLNMALDFVSKNRDRCRIILMGDLLESATKTSVGRSVYDEDFPTGKQFELAVEVFKPYADLIDLVIEGNHEERIIRDTSFEIVQEFCHRIGRYDAYGKFSAIVNYTVGDINYAVYAWHGSTTGARETSAINGLLGMRERCLAHVYLMGHTHKLLSFNREIEIPIPGQDESVVIRQLFVNTGTAVVYGGYGEQKGLPLTRPGFGAIELFADKRKQVFHFIDDLV